MLAASGTTVRSQGDGEGSLGNDQSQGMIVDGFTEEVAWAPPCNEAQARFWSTTSRVVFPQTKQHFKDPEGEKLGGSSSFQDSQHAPTGAKGAPLGGWGGVHRARRGCPGGQWEAMEARFRKTRDRIRELGGGSSLWRKEVDLTKKTKVKWRGGQWGARAGGR